MAPVEKRPHCKQKWKMITEYPIYLTLKLLTFLLCLADFEDINSELVKKSMYLVVFIRSKHSQTHLHYHNLIINSYVSSFVDMWRDMTLHLWEICLKLYHKPDLTMINKYNKKKLLLKTLKRGSGSLYGVYTPLDFIKQT